MTAVDIFRPSSQPGHSVVVLDCFPLPRHIGDRNGRTLPDIERNVFRTYTKLEKLQLESKTKKK